MILRPSITTLGATWSSPRRAEWMLRDAGGGTPPEECQPLPPTLLTMSGFPSCTMNVSAYVVRPNGAGGIIIEQYTDTFDLDVLNGTFAWEEPGTDANIPGVSSGVVFDAYAGAHFDDNLFGFGCSNLAKILIHEQTIHGEVEWTSPMEYTSRECVLRIYGLLVFASESHPDPTFVGDFYLVGVVVNARENYAGPQADTVENAIFGIGRYSVIGDPQNPATWQFTRISETCAVGGAAFVMPADFGPYTMVGTAGYTANLACLCGVDDGGDIVTHICDLNYVTLRIRKYKSTYREHEPYTVPFAVCGPGGTICLPAGYDLMKLYYEAGAIAGPLFTQQDEFEGVTFNYIIPRVSTRTWRKEFYLGPDGVVLLSQQASAPARLTVTITANALRWVVDFTVDVFGPKETQTTTEWRLNATNLPMLCEHIPDPRGQDIEGNLMQPSSLDRGVWGWVGTEPGGGLREWPESAANFHAYVVRLDFATSWLA